MEMEVRELFYLSNRFPTGDRQDTDQLGMTAKLSRI